MNRRPVKTAMWLGFAAALLGYTANAQDPLPQFGTSLSSVAKEITVKAPVRQRIFAAHWMGSFFKGEKEPGLRIDLDIPNKSVVVGWSVSF